jgi:hypothetical protein
MLQVINFSNFMLNYCDYVKLWVYDINYENNVNYDQTMLGWIMIG